MDCCLVLTLRRSGARALPLPSAHSFRQAVFGCIPLEPAARLESPACAPPGQRFVRVDCPATKVPAWLAIPLNPERHGFFCPARQQDSSRLS